MSLFGKLDAANIPSNPYYIEQGEYPAQVSNAGYKTRQTTNGAERQIFIEYVITDETSQFLDQKATQFFTLVDPEMTEEQFALLPKDDQAKIRRNNSALKKTLCGNEANRAQPGLGVPIEDLNDENWDPKILVGIDVNIGIRNWGENNQGVNIAWVNKVD